MIKYLISDFETLSDDGENLLLPTSEQWSQLFDGAKIESQSIIAANLTKILYGLVLAHKELKICLRRLREGGGWTAICLYSKDQIMNQRVHLERLTCNRCKSLVWSANHLDYELYFKTRNPKAMLEMAMKLPSANCPICNAELPRASIFSFVEKSGEKGPAPLKE